MAHRQAAAARLREFIRGLILLRARLGGLDAAQDLVEDQVGLTEFQRETLHNLVGGAIPGGDHQNGAELEPAAPVEAAPEETPLPMPAGLGPVGEAQPSAEPGVVVVRSRASRTAVATVLHALVAKALERLSADVCQIFIQDDEMFALRAEAPADSSAIPGPTVLSRHAGLAAQVGALGRAVALIDLSRLTDAESVWVSRGIQRLAAVGVGTAGDGDSGMLIAARRSTRAFTAPELDEMDRLAVEVSSAMASADLLSRAEELAVLKERIRLAREIHDGLASDLSAVVALFKYHNHRRLTDPADADRVLDQMRALVEGALLSARDILATLRPRQHPPVDLVESVRRQVADFGSTYGLAAAARIEGDGTDVAREERDAMYQILKESLANIRKHSDATAVEVRLDLRRRPYTLQVEDDGIGVDLNAVEDKLGSFGLVGMRERAELLGGWVEIGNSSMGGARVTFRGPQVLVGSQ